ncbi:MAG TPA: hypothetical protein ENN56_05170 [Firmicutes bacterium]|nr:hypothetical protein [Bacillota bacterium]
MDSQTRDPDAVFERFDSVIRETMMQLHRSRGERGQSELDRLNWELERDEMRRAAEERADVSKRAVTEPLRATLRSAVTRIDRILEGTSSNADGATSEDV